MRFRHNLALRLSGLASICVKLRACDQEWAEALYQIANQIGRSVTDVGVSLVRDFFKSTSDQALLLELTERAEREERSLAFFLREALRAGVTRYSAQPWAVPVSREPDLRGRCRIPTKSPEQRVGCETEPPTTQRVES